MSQKIGVITTGGTIGSILAGDAMAVDPGGDIVRQQVNALCERHGFGVVVRPAFNKNSEDLTPVDWGVLIAAVHDLIADGITRIVITHGTDTLAYSAAALGLVFQNQDVRICLTGSFHALEDKNSDGPMNLLAAFHAVTHDALSEPVCVAFRQDDRNQAAHVFRALEILPMGFDDVAFESVRNAPLATVSNNGDVEILSAGEPMRTPTVTAEKFADEALSVAARHILYLDYYPGLSLDRIDHTRLRVLLLGLYHSGTGHALTGQGSLLSMIQHKQDDLIVLGATFPARHISVPYESTAKLIGAGVGIVKDLPVHVLYVFLVLELAGGVAMADILDKLAPWTMTRQSG